MSEDTRTILKQLKQYILDGSEQAAEIVAFVDERKIACIADITFFTGKIAAYNDIYDYIEYELEKGDNDA